MHNVNHIHSCGYHCDKPGCIKEQRDDLVKKFIVNSRNPLTESDLRKAAQALVDRWDTPLWKDAPHTGVFIDSLRAALAKPEQEPVAWMKCINIPGDDWDAYDFSANQYGEFQTPLYTAPPQCKPLTDESLMALLPGAVRLPLGWKDFARAIERAHGIE